jgi:hypothetical protein
LSEALALGYDIANGTPITARFTALQHDHGLAHRISSNYPCTTDPLTLEKDFTVLASVRSPDESGAIAIDGEVEDPGAAIMAQLSGETLYLNVAGASPAEARAVAGRVGSVLPPEDSADPDRIRVVFWAYGPQGPQQTNRELDVPAWDQIEGNYAAETRVRLTALMDPDFRPGRGGQLILWHGEPGTGKTTAIRALAREWREWAKIHYITDSEKFFGEHADYMLQVMLGEDHYDPKGQKREPWRLLLLEDAGELLQKDAKERTGQALARFLNAVDGLIGQGLRVLTLVTTNEELGSWHPAVARHGRALASVEFKPLSVEEASAWLDANEAGGDEPPQPQLLSDLYAIAEGRKRAEARPLVGFAVG